MDFLINLPRSELEYQSKGPPAKEVDSETFADIIKDVVTQIITSETWVKEFVEKGGCSK